MRCDCYPAAAAADVDVLRRQQVSCIKCELVTVLATDSQDGHGGVKTHNDSNKTRMLITTARLIRITAESNVRPSWHADQGFSCY